jgi:hypothetical protein
MTLRKGIEIAEVSVLQKKERDYANVLLPLFFITCKRLRVSD